MQLIDVANLALQAGLSPQAAMAAAAIAQTEGGLNGGVGDNGQSFGPYQFYAGGQLKNFARAMGVSLAEAGHIARSQPDQAIMWALQPGGYLGDTLRAGERQGLQGAELATYAQKHGQVSVSPERAGQNYDNLWGEYRPGGPGGAQPMPYPKGSPAPTMQPMPYSASSAPLVAEPMPWKPRQGTSQIYNTLWNNVMGGAVSQPQEPQGWPTSPTSSTGSIANNQPTGNSGWGSVAPGAATRPSQFEMGQQISPQEAAAWCGPDAAMTFAAAYGRTPTLGEAKQMAASRGWNVNAGMAGGASEAGLISDMGVPSTYNPWSGDTQSGVNQRLSSKQPVILSTPHHYFYASDYDPAKNSYFVGTSGTDLRVGGSEWMTPDQIAAAPMGGQIQGAIWAS